MPSKDGWTHEKDHEKITLGRKQYRNMQEYSRPCAVCGEKFFIHVRASAPSVNASFGLRTCKEHRGQKTGTPGTAVFEQHEELEAVKKELSEYGQTIMDTMAANQALRKENEGLKAKLAKYELQPAMEAITKKLPWEH